MNIAALSNVQNADGVQQLVSIAVMKMAMETVTDQGSSIVAMAQELSVYPHLGANVDIKA